jgi:pimeloyl-ACP methyl ester carboxylesterase
VLPGAFAQAVADSVTVFELDVGHLDWVFGDAEARQIVQPVLSVLGGDSEALWSRFGETHRQLMTWFPDAEEFVFPGVAHGLQMQNPSGIAEGLATFFAHHPLTS